MLSAVLPRYLSASFVSFPSSVSTKVGTVTFFKGKGELSELATEFVTIQSPQTAALAWVGKLSVTPTSKETSVVNVSFTDYNIQRSIDYLRELVKCYNLQANDDKNEKALRTEEFIAERLGKISQELDKTDDKLQKFLEENRTISV